MNCALDLPHLNHIFFMLWSCSKAGPVWGEPGAAQVQWSLAAAQLQS